MRTEQSAFCRRKRCPLCGLSTSVNALKAIRAMH
jgi:hypothetical protein